MKVVGLVTEYNPFHNGHLHHLRESLRVSGAEAGVAVMSGHFLQRGEPALVDKWVRTEMALAAGLDLVFELPLPFACNSAPCFAQGAVQALDGLGIVDALCFGSEAGDLADLQAAARLLAQHAAEIDRQAADLLRQGLNYPTARARIVQRMAPGLPLATLAEPNNILGLEYLRALQQNASPITPLTIRRRGPGYHDTAARGRLASATGIRQRLELGESVQEFLPDACWSRFESALQAQRQLDWTKVFSVLLASLLQEPVSLQGLYQVEHGLAQRLTGAASTAKDYAGLVRSVKSRHWTQTRIQRILAYVMLQVSGSVMAAFLEAGPLYLRLLGMSQNGRKCLAAARARRTLPIIMDPAGANAMFRKFYGAGARRTRLAQAMLELDLRATRLYMALLKSSGDGHRNRDFFEPVRWREGP